MRKTCFAGKQGGKGGDYVPVFLLDIFSKGDKANLTKAARSYWPMCCRRWRTTTAPAWNKP